LRRSKCPVVKGSDRAPSARVANVPAVAATVELRDGRALGYEEWGPGDGLPVLGFLGTPLSLRAHLAKAPDAADIRLVLVDKPGYGRSDFQPGRTLLDWPDDVAQLADSIGLDGFAVFGMSGGGPHAAACGQALSDRVSAVGLVSSPGPVWDRPVLRYSLPPRRQPLVEIAADDRNEAARILLEDCQAELARIARDEDEGDPAADPALRERLRAAMLDATPEGFAHDLLLLFVSPWGFDPEEITVPTLIWHGDRDPAVPLDVARFYERAIPDSKLHVVRGEGHLLLWSRAEEILRSLASR
jgi:pimeloyl-ACP methyl ester carboxylesterase